MEYDRSPGHDEMSGGSDPADVLGAVGNVGTIGNDGDIGNDGTLENDGTIGNDGDIELLEAIENDLADVELALDRLGDGSYGHCETCGQVIGDDELEAAPARRFCRDHLLRHPA